MLLVSTFQVRHPILRFILMKTDDLALHEGLICALEAESLRVIKDVE